MAEPKWLFGKPDKKNSNTGKAKTQENRLASKLGGRRYSNSGARFGENDVRTPDFDIEAKTTAGKGYRITVKELDQISKRASSGKIPLQIINFEGRGEYVVLQYTDFISIYNKAKEKDNE